MKAINKKYKKSYYCKVLTRNDMVIVCNVGNGKTIRLSKECWDVVETYIKDHTVDDICNAMHDEEDKEYMKNVFQNLIENNILLQEELPNEPSVESVDIVITNRCNLQCTHCCADAVVEKEKDLFSTEDIKRIVNEILQINPKSIVITGGEPMVREDFFEIVTDIRKKFQGHMNLMTNGLLITERNVEKIVEIFDGINISLDGYDEESCSKIRGKGVFEKVMQTIQRLIEHGFLRERISISMVETAYTYKNVSKFYELNKRLGTNAVVREFSPIGRGEKNNEELSVGLARRREEKITPKESKEENTEILPGCQTCLAGTTKISINYDGNLYPCLLLDYKEYCLGNVFEIQNLHEYIEKKKYKECSGYQNLHQLLPEYHEKCRDCEFNTFCTYCLADLHRCIKKGYFEQMCALQREELEYIWNAK